jgi:Fe2+ transport system protein FeoA
LTVLAIDASQAEIGERLGALGIFPGAGLKVLHKAPLGDPLQIKAGHTLISIRRQDALAISVANVANPVRA